MTNGFCSSVFFILNNFKYYSISPFKKTCLVLFQHLKYLYLKILTLNDLKDIFQFCNLWLFWSYQNKLFCIGINRKFLSARNANVSPASSCAGTPARLCKTRYNTTAPMYGVSLTSGQPVTIVQKFPDLLQQVVFEVKNKFFYYFLLHIYHNINYFC